MKFRRGIGIAVLYVLPLALWTIFLVCYGAGERGRYEVTWTLIQRGLHALAPEWPPLGDGSIVSLYQLNAAVRRVAHVGAYALLTLLAIRLTQRGDPRLKPASLAVAVLLSAGFMAADEWQRRHEAHRHAKLADFTLDALGVALVLTGALLFFAVKAWERRLAQGSANADGHVPAPSDVAEGHTEPNRANTLP